MPNQGFMVEGAFENSKVKWGRRININNDHYIGEFSENCYHGLGTYYTKDGEDLQQVGRRRMHRAAVIAMPTDLNDLTFVDIQRPEGTENLGSKESYTTDLPNLF